MTSLDNARSDYILFEQRKIKLVNSLDIMAESCVRGKIADIKISRDMLQMVHVYEQCYKANSKRPLYDNDVSALILEWSLKGIGKSIKGGLGKLKQAASGTLYSIIAKLVSAAGYKVDGETVKKLISVINTHLKEKPSSDTAELAEAFAMYEFELTPDDTKFATYDEYVKDTEAQNSVPVDQAAWEDAKGKAEDGAASTSPEVSSKPVAAPAVKKSNLKPDDLKFGTYKAYKDAQIAKKKKPATDAEWMKAKSDISGDQPGFTGQNTQGLDKITKGMSPDDVTVDMSPEEKTAAAIVKAFSPPDKQKGSDKKFSDWLNAQGRELAQQWRETTLFGLVPGGMGSGAKALVLTTGLALVALIAWFGSEYVGSKMTTPPAAIFNKDGGVKLPKIDPSAPMGAHGAGNSDLKAAKDMIGGDAPAAPEAPEAPEAKAAAPAAKAAAPEAPADEPLLKGQQPGDTMYIPETPFEQYGQSWSRNPNLGQLRDMSKRLQDIENMSPTDKEHFKAMFLQGIRKFKTLPGAKIDDAMPTLQKVYDAIKK